MVSARVRRRRKGEDLTATQPQGELPTLAQAVEMREMERAQQMEAAPQLSAQATTSPMGATAMTMSAGSMESAEGAAMRRTVKRKSPPAGADIYDERIGGYGQSMGPKESGEAAVRRIMKVKRKGK